MLSCSSKPFLAIRLGQSRIKFYRHPMWFAGFTDLNALQVVGCLIDDAAFQLMRWYDYRFGRNIEASKKFPCIQKVSTQIWARFCGEQAFLRVSFKLGSLRKSFSLRQLIETMLIDDTVTIFTLVALFLHSFRLFLGEMTELDFTRVSNK